MVCDVLGIEDRETRANTASQPLHVQQVTLLCRYLKWSGRIHSQRLLARFHHRINVISGECTHIGDIMHRLPTPEVTFDLEWPPKNRTNNHAVSSATSNHLWLRHIAVRLLSNVREVDAQAEHVTPVPFVFLRTILAIVVAERGAQALAAGHWAVFGWLSVRWRLQAMLIKGCTNIVIGAMIKFPHLWLLTVLLGEILAVFVMKHGKDVVIDRIDGHNPWTPVVKWCGGLKFSFDFITFCAAQVNTLQTESSLISFTSWMPTPARVCKAQILSTAIFGNPLGAFLLGGAC